MRSRSIGLVTIALLCSIGVVAPATTGADATIAPEATFSAVPGLPDNRVYEQVSPKDKNGNSAGVFVEGAGYAVASADGEAVLFSGSGPMGTSVSGNDRTLVSRRSIGGWSTRAAIPRAKESAALIYAGTSTLLPSADLSHVAFTSGIHYVTAPFPGDPSYSANFYLAGPNPFVEPIWLGQPRISNPEPGLGDATNSQELSLAGGSSDVSTIYFNYSGTLLPEDASRAPHASPDGSLLGFASGFYEWKDGVLSSAAVLPDGSLDPFGALPAAEREGEAYGDQEIPDDFNNQVSTDGSRAFFVSPDPGAPLGECNSSNSGSGGCVPQLYVRETAADGSQSTALVSEDTLLPNVNGLPAPSPDGPLGIKQLRELHEGRSGSESGPEPYVYASADGSQAFFESIDQLTGDAPNNTSPKEYDFNTVTNSLTYLPGVTDGSGGVAVVLASSQDGSRIMFDSHGDFDSKGNFNSNLDIWSRGPKGADDGTVTKITEFPSGSLNSVRATPDGSVFVFATNSVLPGGFNNSDGPSVPTQQVYRYEAGSGKLSCVSCPPVGVIPSGGADLSHGDTGGPTLGVQGTLIGTRGMSADGSRVFFDTPDPLVSQDTDGVRDVYEWEGGGIYLISSGTSALDSFLLDNGASGGDVFFATAEGLAAGDTDGAYDVYDARIPRPGDDPPPSAVPCEGDVCQGPPRVPSPLGAPASATFSGLGNVAQQSSTKPAAKKKSKLGKSKSKKKAKKTKRSKKAARARKATLKSAPKRKGEG